MTFVRCERRNFLICGVVEVKLRTPSIHHLLPTTKPNPVDIGAPFPDYRGLWSVTVDQLQEAAVFKRRKADTVSEAEDSSLTISVQWYKDVLADPL